MKIQEKIRVRTFSEFMAPAIQGNSGSVPDTDGSRLMSTNTFNIAWMDYEIAKDWKIVYWQRFIVNFASPAGDFNLSTYTRNPRFAIRRVNFFSNPNISSTYDLYIQPGLGDEAAPSAAGRTVEGGFRTNTSYVVPRSKWNIGAITEFTVSYSKTNTTDANIYGWAMPWMSYDLTPTFSTQHYATINFQHLRGKNIDRIDWDYPMPYTQNGIGINVSKVVWASIFINNYLTTAPTLKNTWASLWIALTLL
jgi:hypothetical protein